MAEKHGAANCQWATPTLFLDPPLWLEASSRPWTCVRDDTPAVLDSTEQCAACPRWDPRVESHRAWREAVDDRTAPTLVSVRDARG